MWLSNFDKMSFTDTNLLQLTGQEPHHTAFAHPRWLCPWHSFAKWSWPHDLHLAWSNLSCGDEFEANSPNFLGYILIRKAQGYEVGSGSLCLCMCEDDGRGTRPPKKTLEWQSSSDKEDVKVQRVWDLSCRVKTIGQFQLPFIKVTALGHVEMNE